MVHVTVLILSLISIVSQVLPNRRHGRHRVTLRDLLHTEAVPVRIKQAEPKQAHGGQTVVPRAHGREERVDVVNVRGARADDEERVQVWQRLHGKVEEVKRFVSELVRAQQERDLVLEHGELALYSVRRQDVVRHLDLQAGHGRGPAGGHGVEISEKGIYRKLNVLSVFQYASGYTDKERGKDGIW